MKSNCSSFQPCSTSKVLTLSACIHVLLALFAVTNQDCGAVIEMHTPWQTTHSGIPSGSSHSPRLNGRVTLPSFPVIEPPVSYADVPLLRCCHSFIVCSMDSVDASPREEVMPLIIIIQSLICRIQRHGSFQSSNMTRSVSGMKCGVNIGFRRGAKAVEESERKYIDSLARMSNNCQLYISISRCSRSNTFVISIKHILVSIS